MAVINAQERLINAINELCAPIELALQSDENAQLFFKALGWDFDRIEGFPFNDLIASISDIYDLVLEVRGLLEDPPESIEELAGCLDVVRSLFNTINSVASFIDGISGGGITTDFKTEFIKLPIDIINYMICGYLEANYFKLYATLSVLGIITPHQTVELTPTVSSPNETWIRLPYYKSTIQLNNLVDLLSDPDNYFKEQFYPASGQLNTAAEAQEFCDKFFPRLGLLFQSLGFETIYGMDESDEPLYTPDAFSVMRRTLTVIYHTSDFADYGATLTISPTSEGGHGLVVSLFGDWSYNIQLQDWLLILKASLSVDVFSINESGIHFSSSFTDIEFSVLIQLMWLNTDNALVGSTTGTRFNIKDITTGSYLNYSYEKVSYGFAASFKGIEFFIGGEGDSFINKIIPNGAGGTFDLLFSWDSMTGFQFNAAGGMEFLFPVNKKVGPIDFEGVTLGIYIENGAISIRGGGSISLDIGPITASVKNIGLKADITFPNDNANLGICNLDLAFKPPTGVGLSIDAPPVKGGGFLDYDEATYTYTGGLELNFSKISFSAIGILSTKLPGGGDGYSLLIIITAEFGPIPLGMGFTLNGLGGLLGLNRTMNPDALRDGIKNNTLDNILFPHDIVKNANTIISNIGQCFPAQKDQFIIGPMAKIGWGTPTLLTIELGIMIELPNPVRLAILGIVKAILPTEDKDILRIQVNFLGIIDFDNKYISFDASLYDSRILTFGLFGDMALRIYWGDQPNFLLSVGGFHPKYTPPPLNLPQMTRLTIVLANENSLQISVETYFAITSNSVQFGAKVYAMAKAWKIQAVGALWFDILFQFSPFHFIADMGVMFAIKMGSKTILSIFVDLSLEGPHPWVAQGTGSFKILFVKVKVSFNKTFGQADTEALQAAAIDDKFTEALQNKDNWQAIVPDRNNQLVSYKQIDAAQLSDLVVDPAGRLRFSQNLLPLDTVMGKFGNSAISDYNKYSITGITGMGTYGISPVQDYFARNEFFNMSDDDKLSKPSYELFNSGIIAGSDDIVSSYAVHRLCDYEQVTIDTGYRRLELRWPISFNSFNVHMFGNYVGRSRVGIFDKVTTQSGPKQVMLNHDEDEFVLINRNDMSVVSTGGYSSSVEAERALQVQLTSQPAVASDWVVANRFELDL